MKLYQQFVSLGIRYMPDYDTKYEQQVVEIDCHQYLDDIRALGKIKGNPLALEKILTKARLPTIREHIQPKTLIYTYYIQDIDLLLKKELEQDGWQVGFYTGEDKTGLNGFINGDIDVLIGSSTIGTGVDGLQQVCNRIIINVLPWTNAEFEQLKGRVYRQSQEQDLVTMIIPITYADVAGERWSWGEAKMQPLKFKKSIADAAVDGVVPEKNLRSPAQAYQDIMGWLQRLDGGDLQHHHREAFEVVLAETESEETKRTRKYGDFSKLNHRWNTSNCSNTHQRLIENVEEWQHYHALYREARKDWKVIPFEEMIKWAKQRSDYVIGDFGCGEAILAQELSEIHTVHSFDITKQEAQAWGMTLLNDNLYNTLPMNLFFLMDEE